MLGLGSFISKISSATAIASYKSFYSTVFGGTDEYARVEGNTENQALWPNSSSNDRGWSISFWLKSKDDRHLFTTTPENQPSINIQLRDNGNLTWRMYGGRSSSVYQELNLDTTVVPSNNTISDWRHVVLTFNLASSASSMIAYLDGELHSDEEGNATYSSSGTWAAVTGLWNHTAGLGGGQGDTISWGYGGAAYSDIAGIDEVAIFDEVLTQSQVNSLYNEGTPVNVEDVSNYLTGWWKMGDEDTHPNIVDHSGNGYDMTMYNMESGDFLESAPRS